MKNKTLLIAMSFFFLTACTKSALDTAVTGGITVIPASSVPQATRAAFTASFSGATEVEWHQSGSNSFTCQFNFNNQRHDAGFDDSGHQSSHSVIGIDAAVPQIVLDAFRLRFPTDNVYEWKLRTDGTWKAHFMRGTVKWEATYSAGGVLIKVEQG